MWALARPDHHSIGAGGVDYKDSYKTVTGKDNIVKHTWWNFTVGTGLVQDIQQQFGRQEGWLAGLLPDDRFRQFPLVFLQQQDFFLQGILGDQAVHLHRIDLADAIGAIGGLVLGRSGSAPSLPLSGR